VKAGTISQTRDARVLDVGMTDWSGRFIPANSDVVALLDISRRYRANKRGASPWRD
jgi:hypothetical protein